MQKNIEVIKINIAANSHPEDIYLDLFKKAANKRVKYSTNNEKTAKLSPPKEIENGKNFYSGYLRTYTTVSKDRKWINTDTDRPHSDEEKEKTIFIPENTATNACQFAYILDTTQHYLYIEKKNSTGTILVSQIKNIISRLMKPSVQGNDDLPQIEITIIPKKEIVEHILKAPNLRKLVIHIVTPNPDSTSDESLRRVLENMERQNATSSEYTLINNQKQKGITPDDNTKELARIAKDNGYVRGIWTNENGEKNDISTKNKPDIINVDVQDNESLYQTLLRKHILPE